MGNCLQKLRADLCSFRFKDAQRGRLDSRKPEARWYNSLRFAWHVKSVASNIDYLMEAIGFTSDRAEGELEVVPSKWRLPSERGPGRDFQDRLRFRARRSRVNLL